MLRKFKERCRFAAPVVIFSAMVATTSNATAQPLSWPPPPCGDANYGCVDLDVGAMGHQQLSLSPSNDYRLHLPSDRAQIGGITISGGRNVILIGVMGSISGSSLPVLSLSRGFGFAIRKTRSCSVLGTVLLLMI